MLDQQDNKPSRRNNPYVILFIVLAIATVIAVMIPPGIIEGGRYRALPHQVPGFQHVFNLFLALPYGMKQSASLIILILIIGGALQVYQQTGAIDQGIQALVDRFGRRSPSLLVAILFVVFSACGGFLGWVEILIPFGLLIIGVIQSLGLDPLIGVGVLVLGSMGGFVTGATNLYTVAVANELARQLGYVASDYDILTGLGPRLVIWGIMTLMGVAYLLIYMQRHSTPGPQPGLATTEFGQLTVRQSVVLIILLATTLISVIGMRTGLGGPIWSIDEVSGAFLCGAIIAGLIGQLSGHRIAEAIIAGAGQAMGAAIVIGAASGVFWLLEVNHATGTFIHYLSQLLGGLSPLWMALGIMGVTALLNGIIPYGAGQVALLMPIFIPIGLESGLSLQSIILAHQLGGATLMVWFTYGALLIFLGQGQITLKRWYQFIGPYLFVFYSLSLVILLWAVRTQF